MTAMPAVFITQRTVFSHGVTMSEASCRWLLVTALFLTFHYCLSATKNRTTLVQVHVLFRHGDRAPVESYPNDPDNADYWPNGYAQLTKAGLQMQQRLGSWFRSRYSELLSDHWNCSEIEVTSTSVDRTLNSAQANLQGLYSGRPSKWRYQDDLDWSPVPVRSSLPADDKLLNVDESCARIKEEEKKVLALPEVAAVTRECEPLFRLLTDNLGKPIEDLKHLEFAYDYFRIHVLYNISLPDWLVPHFQQIKKAALFTYDLLGYTDALKLLRGGPLINKIINDMERKTNSSVQSPNFYMYSAHDTTIAVNLQTLGLYNHMIPPYAATVLYELHLKNGLYVVNLLYRNDTVQPGGTAYKLTLPGCDTDCPLQLFRTLMAAYLPTDYEAQCTIPDGSVTLSRAQFRALIWLGVITLLLISVLLTLYLIARQRYFTVRSYALLTAQAS